MTDRDPLYRRHRFPPEIIAHAVWLYFRFPLSLRMVEDLLAARGIIVSHQTVRLWAEKFGRTFAMFQHVNNAADHTPVIDTRDTVRQREIRPDPAKLRGRQQKQITHGKSSCHQ
jgi:hypothetical protein